MACFLGFDSSNYTTSVACYHAKSGILCHSKRLLPVEQGALGLRQSDALFHHIRQLPEILSQALEGEKEPLAAVCASEFPRRLPDSYMPCFLAGKTVAQSIATTEGVPYYGVSHQEGHLAAALYSAGRLDLLTQNFLGFHVSGGTMEVLLVTPDPEHILSVRRLAATLDISAGQLIDRVGVRLGLPFPAGPHLERLAREGTLLSRRPIRLKDGCCNLSGMENMLTKMLEQGTTPADAARFLLDYLAQVLCAMTRFAQKEAGPLPVVYSGGVLCNTFIREALSQMPENPEAIFAKPEFSSDNAAGVAVLGSLLFQKEEREAP